MTTPGFEAWMKERRWKEDLIPNIVLTALPVLIALGIGTFIFGVATGEIVLDHK